jgi:glycosyltransferase involved in cell wall biosynthesis
MITIITVVFNGEQTIRDTIESVCHQTLLPTEYIIIDGLSTDGTLSIVKEYMQRFPFIKLISEKDNGIYDAMNKGLSIASGELIGMINSDDWYELTALEKMSKAYILSGSGVYFGILRNIKNGMDYYLERTSQDFVSERMIPHPTTFVSKDIYVRYGVFDLKYKYSSDLEWVLRLVKNQVPFRHLDDIIANFRIGGASASLNAGIESLNILKAYGRISIKQYAVRLTILRLKFLLRSSKSNLAST